MLFARTTRSLPALCVVVGGLAVTAGCYERPPSTDPGRVVYEFEGVVENGDVRLWGYSVEDEAPDFARSMATRQALTPIVEDKNGVRGTAAIADSIEMTVQRNAPYTAPVVVTNGCGLGNNSFDVTVGVRNFAPTRLTNVHVELTSIRDNTGGTADHSLCNSEPVGRNQFVDGTPPSNALGLIRYGNLGADDNGIATPPAGVATDANGPLPEPLGNDPTAHAMLWRFRNGAGNFTFNGRVVADVCAAGDCVPGTITGHSAAIQRNPRGFDTDGIVNAVAEGDGVVYLGGSFSRVGPRTGAAFGTVADTAVEGAALSLIPAFEGGTVQDILPDGAGGLYIGGTFTHVANQPRARLVHLNADGTIDTGFSPPASVTGNGQVLALGLDSTNGNLWIGRQTSPFIVVVNAATGAETLLPQQPGDEIREIQAVNDLVVVSGQFTNFGGSNSRDKIAIFNGVDGTLTSFALPVNGGGGTEVETFVTDGQTIWIGGDFTGVGRGAANARNRLAALDIATNALLPWNPNAGAIVNALELIDVGGTPVIIAGGNFTTVSGTTRTRLAAIEADPTIAAPALRVWAPEANANVLELAQAPSGDILVGGAFTNISGTARNRLAALEGNVDVAAPALRAWNPSVAQTVRSVAVDTVSNRFLVGGDFTFGGGTLQPRLAALDLATGELVASFGPSIGNGQVNAITVAGGLVWAGGTFTVVDGVTRNRLAAFAVADGATNAAVPQASGTVSALASNATHVYVGGAFTNLGGNGALDRIARLDLSGAVDNTWSGSAIGNGAVFALAVDASGVYAGGSFTAPANRLGRFNLSTGGSAANYNAVGGDVLGVALRHQRLYAVGDFTSLLGQGRTRAGAINLLTDGIDGGFAPASINNVANTVDVAGNTVVVGGTFTAPRLHLAAFDNVSGALQPFAPLPLNQATAVNDVAIVGGVVVAGGNLEVLGSQVNTTGTTTERARRRGVVFVHAE